MTEEASREQRDAFYGFLAKWPVRHFGKREVIVQQDELPEAMYIARTGIIKSYNITPQGEEKPIAFVLKDEPFPLSQISQDTGIAQYYYEALTDCDVYVVPFQEYIDFLRAEPACLFELYRSLAKRSIEYQMRINALEQSRASDKVLHTLYFLAHRFGKDINDTLIKVQLPLTQQDIANFMGLTRETTAIEFKKLERRGILTYGHHTFTVHRLRLKELLGEEYRAEDVSSIRRIAELLHY